MRRDSGYALAGGVLVGAAAVYFLDPVQGAERRARIWEELCAAAGWARGERAPQRERTAQDPLRLLLEGRVSDRLLYDRCRAAVARLTTHPDWIAVSVQDGVARLSGRVPEEEVTDVVFGLRRVPGLVRLESRLRAVRRGRVEEVTPVDAALAGPGRAAIRALAAGAVVAFTRPESLAGLALVLGAGFLAAGASVRRRDHQERERRTLRESVTVSAPVERVFAYWTDARHFPDFAEGLSEVRESEAGVSEWILADAAEEPRAAQVEISHLKPHRRIEWRTVEGTPNPFTVEVEFYPEGRDRTTVSVALTYEKSPEAPYPLRRALQRMAANFCSRQASAAAVPQFA
jgi:uncharacterized membrane protein